MTSNVSDDLDQILISAEALQLKISELATRIAADYSGKNLMLVGVLKGAVIFLVDLARAIPLPLEIDFMAVSSYGMSTQTSGIVRIVKDLESSLEDKHVLIVEDIVDTGLTLKYIRDVLQDRSPASLRICALLNKNKPRKAALHLDYVGFDIPDLFVVGYGLDYGELYRNLSCIGVLRANSLRQQPG